MPYVLYHTLDDEWKEAYFIKEHDHFSAVCHPVCYEWLKKINKLDEIETLQTNLINNDFFTYKEIETPNSSLESWIFSFSVKDEDIKHLHYIATFFQYFFDAVHLPLSKRLEHVLYRNSIFIPMELTGRLLTFILNNYKEDPERIRVMFHPVIQKYI
jgi:hypothetical protein